MYVIQYRVLLDDDRKVTLVKENSCDIPFVEEHLNTPQAIVDLVVQLYAATRLAEEHAWLLAMDLAGHLIGMFELSHGDCGMTCMGVREIFIRLSLIGAKRFVIVHNHPSGNVVPSATDIESTRKLKAASELMGIILDDHIIIGDSYYSMAEHENV